MQLTVLKQRLLGGVLVAASLLPAQLAFANGVEAESRLTLFREPSNLSKNAGVTVYHPQTDVKATLGEAFNIAAS